MVGLPTAVLIERVVEVVMARVLDAIGGAGARGAAESTEVPRDESRDERRTQPVERTRKSGGLLRDESRDERRAQPVETQRESGGLLRDESRDETAAGKRGS